MAIPRPPFTDGQVITLPSGKKMQWSESSGRLVNAQPAPSAVVSEVVETAAAEAQQKANEAQAAAEATAAVDAQQKAEAAQAAAEATAAVDAQQKADAAQAAAVTAAAEDAQQKADAAVAAAAEDAQQKADVAQAAAVAAAAVEAETKATAAATQAIADVTGGASEAFDTLKEIQDVMATDAELSEAINQISSQQLALNGNELSISDGNTVDLSSISGGGGTGEKGDTGDTGPAGADGAVGPAGPAGPAGADGADSTVPGPKGDTGDAGADGAAGPAGADGADSTVPGPKGDTGDTGADGAVGPAGADGADSTVPGPKGDTGDAGAVGPSGPQGQTGITGPTGPQGIQGIQGAAGLGITFLGEVATESALPTGGNTQGDAYLVQTDDSLHVWDNTAWVSGGSIQGPQGIQGAAGEQGIQGESGTDGLDSTVPGPKGDTGDTGPVGPAGADGADGADGAVGPAGADGADGASNWTNITGTPTTLAGYGITDGSSGGVSSYNDLTDKPTIPVDVADLTDNGLLLLHNETIVLSDISVTSETPSGTTSTLVYNDTDGVFTFTSAAEGAAGAVGPAGADGADGADGAVGPAGPAGPAGADGTDSTVPGPKGDTGDTGADGAVGPAGADGADGADGAVGPAGADGADSTVPGPKGDTGDTGADGAVGPVGPQGAQGPAGPDGPQGEPGPTGLIGPAGADGADGADSTVPGPKGDTGDTGPAGADGADSTVPGPKGDTGDTGADGAVGPAGPVGPAGADGADSTVAGPQGLKGDTGDTGPVGPAGATTMTGLTDTLLSNVQPYNFLQWNGSAWINDYASIRHLEDVDSAGPLSDDNVMVWNSGNNQFEFKQHQTITSLSINANVLKYTDEDGVETDIDLSTYLDDTNLARISGGTLDANTGVATFTRDDNSTFTLDLSDLLNITLSDISVGTPATASGNGDLSYNNTTGVFTYTPPVIPSDISDLTDNSNAIPSDISDLTDTTSVIPTDFSDLTDNNNTLAGTITSSDLDMGGKRVLFANVYNNEVDLPSATTYHGMFAHVHGTGKGYYAHAGSWIPLATESQVANITFNDINSKPTTIAGYGITDAVEDFADLGITPTTLAGYGITDVVPTELSDLTDVSIVSPSDGQIMLWNATNNRFEVGEVGSTITKFEKGIYEVATNKSHALNTNVSGDAAANSGGTVIFDTSINGNLFHYYNNQMNSPSWTADITNLPLANYQFTNVTIIIRQRPWGNTGTVASLPTTYKLDGQTYTIRWSDGLTPSATINGVDVIQLTIMPIETSDGTGVPIYNTTQILGSHTSHPY